MSTFCLLSGVKTYIELEVRGWRLEANYKL